MQGFLVAKTKLSEPAMTSQMKCDLQHVTILTMGDPYKVKKQRVVDFDTQEVEFSNHLLTSKLIFWLNFPFRIPVQANKAQGGWF